MLLAVDIGNTNIVVAVFKGEDMAFCWRLATETRRTEDDYAAVLFTLAGHEGLDLRECRTAIISSVVPALTASFAEVIRRGCGCRAYILTPAILNEGILPVSMVQGAAAEIGTDLICDAMGAWERFKTASIVVDFGTALSFVVTDSRGVIRGVDIAPGLLTAVKSLFTNTAQLPQVPLAAPPSSLGTNTVEAIQAGVVLGYKGLVEFLVAAIKQELFMLSGDKPESVRVIATGGLSGVLAGITDVFTAVDSELTIRGLRAIASLVCEISNQLLK